MQKSGFPIALPGIMLPVSEVLSYALGSRLESGGDAHRLRYTSKLTDEGALRIAPVVVWNITNACNMACPHCYSNAKLGSHSTQGLSFQDSLRVIERLREANVKILIFSGGEPLLREDWPDLARAASKAGMGLYLSTNGVLIDSKTATLLKDLGFRYVGVSLDGMADFNDSYRHFAGGFDAAFRGIQNALEAGILTGLRITLSERNASHLFPLLDEAAERGVSRFYVSHLVYGGRGIGYSRNDQALASKRRLMHGIFSYALEHLDRSDAPKIVTGGNDADCAALYLFIKNELGEAAANRAWELLARRGGNSAGEKLVNIDHSGNLHPDQFWRSVSTGNVLEEPLESLMQRGVFALLPRRTELLEGRCAECAFLPLCRGSHRERAEIVHKNIWAEDPACYVSENAEAFPFESQVLHTSVADSTMPSIYERQARTKSEAPV